MTVTKTEIEKLSKLARLYFSEEELEKFAGEFDEIIAFADTINQSVEGGTSEIRSVGTELVNFENLREDIVMPSLPNEKIVSNVEDKDGFFSLKRSKK
ncbi:glutamyl-tRNA(Gln) amidotransferase subunit C [Oxobacter pfennigii]|uniref:Glutamyl-tRNA(Gln) amidotransferase subunit C n=1 Tax=Oxobacter pfennigii TaxID=36849 RepID=A0A0P8X0S9_9CLOT|nr:Asp-tRNA(Asn)/Glu-tRNA(Gln) amidotransferase subunit GatC [Oxobacter pfennigii]KPU44383.1 glutamyl-tRNA(Gln) amidotransferase subunit C [Oxobacter pfennigii]